MTTLLNLERYFICFSTILYPIHIKHCSLQVDNPLSKLNITKAQNDTYSLLKSLIGPDSKAVIRQIVTDVGGSTASFAFDTLVDGDTIMEAVESFAVPEINGRIEKFVKSNSRLEKIRVWFNNKGMSN